MNAEQGFIESPTLTWPGLVISLPLPPTCWHRRHAPAPQIWRGLGGEEGLTGGQAPWLKNGMKTECSSSDQLREEEPRDAVLMASCPPLDFPGDKQEGSTGGQLRGLQSWRSTMQSVVFLGEGLTSILTR